MHQQVRAGNRLTMKIDRLLLRKFAVRKEQLKKSGLAATTQRTQLTAYTASLKSRQEEVPLLGKYIDHAKSEPLHIKNNTTKELFMKMFKIVVSQSNLKNVKMFSEISPDNLFSNLFSTFDSLWVAIFK